MSKINKVIAVYAGRFQPFHIGHFNTYKAVVKKFGENNTFIGTSDKTAPVKSPLNFKEKEMVMHKMFPALKGKVTQVKNPYAPKEILENYDPETTAFVTVLSEKDAKRLGGKYFDRYSDKADLQGFNEKGYVWVAEKDSKDELFMGEPISGTLVRSVLGDKSNSDADKKDLFKVMYKGKFDKKVFNLLTSKIVNEGFEYLDFEKYMLMEEAKNGLLLDSTQNFSNAVYESITSTWDLLNEGGAFGHLAHPYEEVNMTFQQMKDLIISVLDNNVDYNVEKTDGQNLMISYKNGRVVAARNKSHLKDAGEKAIDVDGIKNMFAGRGEIQKAFGTAMEDLEKAFRNVSDDELVDIFHEGKNFMTLEVIFPATTNAIPYGHSLLVFQGLVSHDLKGNPLDYSRAEAIRLDKLIAGVNASVQNEYKIMMQPSLELPENTAELKKKYLPIIDSIKGKYNLSDSNLIKDYMKREWDAYLEQTEKDLKYTFSEDIKSTLLARWIDGIKQPNISAIKKSIDNKKVENWVSAFEKKEIKKVQKNIRKPFEILFLRLGADLLKEISSVLTLNSRESSKQMIANIKKLEKEVRATNDPSKIEKLEAELERLEALGGFDNIVPIEGIVFQKNGVLYKLTGTFAPVNQLLGVLKYSR